MSSAPDKTKEDKKLVSLEEDDEFEDFPVEDWGQAETEIANESENQLWEEQWDDDDDVNENFAEKLREEAKKIQGEPMAQ
ncbi:26S proteasome complex subunit Sem1p [Trichomonascus vanleenenianus]|uniref:proteasome regulatory particle lid subunit SEM1 n=1 Tax=Trichomonascus vanleenenianus TaxID=2268995 RepID=UPI003ECB7F23